MTNAHRDRQCPKCSLKHVSQAKACAKLARLLVSEARILAFETLKGYDAHYWDALGHLAQAEDEIVVIMPEVATVIRGARKVWEADCNKLPDFRALQYAINDGAMLERPSDRKACWDREQTKMELGDQGETVNAEDQV